MKTCVVGDCVSLSWTEVFSIGKYSPALGGYFAGFSRWTDSAGVSHPTALVVAGATYGEIGGAKWGRYGDFLEGAVSRQDGMANTLAMLAADSEAALAIRRLSIYGFADWYLPSLAELNIAAANVPELFDTDDDYWTSTQESKNMAYVCSLRNGYTVSYRKDVPKKVRAMRRVNISVFIAQSAAVLSPMAE